MQAEFQDWGEEGAEMVKAVDAVLRNCKDDEGLAILFCILFGRAIQEGVVKK